MAKQLTHLQTEALDYAQKHLRQAHEEARKRLATAGFELSEEPHLECLTGDGCEGFRPRPGVGGTCATPGCGHSLFMHNLPT